MRGEAEKNIALIGQEPLPTRQDYDRGVGFGEAVDMRNARFNGAFEGLRRINLRIEAIKTGVFKGVCLNCKGDIKKENLLENPLMDRCVDCQKAMNGKKK